MVTHCKESNHHRGEKSKIAKMTTNARKELCNAYSRGPLWKAITQRWQQVCINAMQGPRLYPHLTEMHLPSDSQSVMQPRDAFRCSAPSSNPLHGARTLPQLKSCGALRWGAFQGLLDRVDRSEEARSEMTRGGWWRRCCTSIQEPFLLCCRCTMWSSSCRCNKDITMGFWVFELRLRTGGNLKPKKRGKIPVIC